jgi:hypothetical protein
VAAAECKVKKVSTEGTPDHFEKMLEGPCSNHTYPVKHAYKDCGLMKKLLSRVSKQGDRKKKPDPSEDDTREKEDAFSEETDCLMIFGGPTAYDPSAGRSSHIERCTRLSRPLPPSSGGRGPPSHSIALTTQTVFRT